MVNLLVRGKCPFCKKDIILYISEESLRKARRILEPQPATKENKHQDGDVKAPLGRGQVAS